MSDRNVTPSTTGLSDRLAEVRARLDAYKRDGYAAEIGDHFTADDIAWLLDEVERLRRYTHHAHNDCWQSGKCVCGLGGDDNA